MNLTLLLHLVLAGAGAWWWARRGWRLDASPAVAVGILFPCSAWFWGHQEHLNQVATAAWMPWLLALALLRARGDLTRPAFLASYATLAALQLLVGHPQGAFYTHFFAALLLLGRAATLPNPARNVFDALIDLALAGGIALLAASIQLLPTSELQKLSYRQFAPNDPSYALTYSMPPDQLITALLPNHFGSYAEGWQDLRAYNEYGLHIGRLALALAVFGTVALLVTRRRRTALALGGGLLLTLLMALGGNASIGRALSGEFSEQPASWRAIPAVMQDVDAGETPTTAPRLSHLSLHEALLAVIPPMRGFRAPARALVLTALLAITLAGFGLHHLVRLLARRRDVGHHVPLVLGIVIPALMLADLALASRGQSFRHPVPQASLLHAVERERGDYRDATLDNRVWRLTVYDAELLVAERQLDTAAKIELEFEETPLWARWMRLFENNNVVARIPSTHGYEEGLAPTVRTKDFFFEINRNLRGFTPDPQLLALLGVSRIWTDLPHRLFDTQTFPAIGTETYGPRRIFEVPTHLGAAFWESQAEGIDFIALEGPHHRGQGVHPRGNDEPIDYGKAPRWDDPRLPRLATDVSQPNQVLIRWEDGYDMTRDAVLLTMAYAPGWYHADGPLEWISAVHARIPPTVFKPDGSAVIVYRPETWRAGLFLSLVGWSLIAALATFAWRSAGHSQPPGGAS